VKAAIAAANAADPSYGPGAPPLIVAKRSVAKYGLS